jgi:hypothetical protein
MSEKKTQKKNNTENKPKKNFGDFVFTIADIPKEEKV